MFSGEAYNVEMGVTNELFPQAVEELPACNGPKRSARALFAASSCSEPTPAIRGIGCFACHTPSMKTAAATEFEVLQDKPANLYSDLLIHHMGPGLADRITQGLAGGDMFRTTPLWGVGQRMFFLHDGRTSDLMQAILAHSSAGQKGDDNEQVGFPPSEANAVIDDFRNLSSSDKQGILDFIRSL